MNLTSLEQIIVCPACKKSLSKISNSYKCEDETCDSTYPVFNGIPILINPKNDLFEQKDFEKQSDIFFKTYNSGLTRFLKKIQPGITYNNISEKNYIHIAGLLKDKKPLRILILGGSVDGVGIKHLKEVLQKEDLLVETDVSYGPNTTVICDAHEIPFADDSFDLIIAQAVLEHVLDPFLCVREMHRVIKNDGLIYAETPFMQQVHGGKYDFLRFTHLGHRRMFRTFNEIDSGVVAGAGSALVWSLKYFLTSFANSKKVDRVLSYGGTFLFFWLKYFDKILNKTKGTIDAASGFYFLGRKEKGYLLSDKELLSSYRGFRYSSEE
ncbi:methyltransferase domain-containing protein [Daejeonella sp.]|uniref:methyltransferase domain-containing protein n=1 Tax=Daejeonella sp. TaxID=2805397 RepID=UPI0030C42673